jgi:hypothetical protein
MKKKNGNGKQAEEPENRAFEEVEDISLDKLQEVSARELIRFFTGPSAIRESKTTLNAVRLAVSSLSAVGRLKATERAKDATQLAVLQSLSKDRDQFEKYLKVSMPHLNPAALIEG